MASTPLRPARASSSRPTSACCSPSRPTNMSRVYGATRYEAMPPEVRTKGLPGSEGTRAPPTFPVRRRTQMTTTEQPTEIDMEKLMGFVFRAVDEVGATLNTALVVMGDRLGLYRALAGAGPLTPAELAQRTGTAERYVREWLNAQAAGAYVDYDPDSGRYTLPAEYAIALTDESSPAYLPGFFQTAFGSVLDSPRITEAAKTSKGV